MFQSPKSSSYVAPADPIDPNERYLVKVVDLVDAGVSKFAEADDPNPVHRICWTFRMANLDGTPILNIDGDPYEHRDYTSNKTSKGKKTAQARLWMEALLGPLEDAEIDANIVSRLKEKVAVALFEEVQAGGDGGEEYTRLPILRLAPYKKGQPAAAPAPAPARRQPVAAGATAESDAPPF